MSTYQIVAFLIQFIVILSNLITLAVIVRVIVSWFSIGNPYNRGRFSQFIYNLTDPIMNLVKKIPHRIGMIDLSPLIVLIGVDLLSRLIINVLSRLVS